MKKKNLIIKIFFGIGIFSSGVEIVSFGGGG